MAERQADATGCLAAVAMIALTLTGTVLYQELRAYSDCRAAITLATTLRDTLSVMLWEPAQTAKVDRTCRELLADRGMVQLRHLP